MKIGVIIAMDIEYRQMHDAIGGDTGRLGSNDIVLWQCGIGKVNAAVGTMRLYAEHRPRRRYRPPDAGYGCTCRHAMRIPRC